MAPQPTPAPPRQRGRRRYLVRAIATALTALAQVAMAAGRQLGPADALELMRLERQGEYARKRAQCDALRINKEVEPAIRCLEELITMGYDELLQPNLLQPQDVTLLQELRATLEKEREEERRRLAARQQFQRVFDQARKARSAGEYRQAKRLMEDALKRNPAAGRDPDFLREFNLAQADYRDYLVRLGVLWSAAALVTAGGIVGLVRTLRTRRTPPNASLEMIEGSQPGEVFAIGKNRVVVGTSATEADIRIVDLGRRVSRLHCEIARRGSRYYVTDVSSNGTTLNGRPLDRGRPHALRAGDVIGLAPDVTLRFGA